MRILFAGASGMIGSVVAPYLAGRGHEVIRLVRREPAAGEVRWDPEAGTIDTAGIEDMDAVVHLASMPWPMRWTRAFKQQIHANRIATNRLLAESLAACTSKPQVLICASGMGIYPASGDQVIDEDSPTGPDWLAGLQRDGEAATAPPGVAGIRVVNLRIPAVLGGPNLQRGMGRMGNGRQWSSWVARDELASIIEHVLVTESLRGPVNPVSPNPVRNAEFATTYDRVRGSRGGLPIPAFLLRLLFGEMAEALILASRRIMPARLLESCYEFRFADLTTALTHELSKG